MDSVLRRIRNLPSVVNKKQYKQWRHRQTDQNNSIQIYGRHIQFSSRSFLSRIKGQTMWPNGQERSATRQMSRCFNSQVDDRLPFRYWESTDADVTTENAAGLPFKIISYNILAQDLLIEHLQIYKFCNQLYLKWSHRLSKINEEILAQRPDILCLQEVQENHLGDIITNIKSKLPMSCLFKKKTGFKSDGCAIFYNDNLFELVDSDVVEYYQPGFKRLDRHNIALIAKLRCKSKPDVHFLVCTTHLLYNPKRQDVRLAQIMVLLAELDRHSVVETKSESSEIERIPIILTGDFNFEPCSAPFELITTGKLCYERLSRNTLTETDSSSTLPIDDHFISPWLGITDNCQHIDCVKSNYTDRSSRLHNTRKKLRNLDDKPVGESYPELFSTGTLTHELNLKSMYNHFGAQSYGSTHQNEWITVDHMFYSEARQRSSHQGYLKLLSVYQLPSVQQCSQLGHLPNEVFGSDHLMLASHLYLGFPTEK